MKSINSIFLISTFCFISACIVTKAPYIPIQYNSEQVFSDGIGLPNIPGKCYAKSMNNQGVKKWTEILCETPDDGQIREIQNNLTLLGYNIDASELENGFYGESTKSAFFDFQKNEDMSFGILDGASIMRLRFQSR